VKHLAVLLVYLLVTQLAAQSRDSSLTGLLGHLLRSELRGGGWRDTLVWEPYDSMSSDLLHRFKLGPRDTLLPAGSRSLQCPGSTDSSWTAFAQPVGYVVHARVRFHTRDSATVDLGLTCRFIFRGRAHGFAETASWEVTKAMNGSWVARLLNRSITKARPREIRHDA
jgi:hypothetical protein